MCVCVYRTDTRTNSRGVPSPVSLIARYMSWPVRCGRVDCGVARSQPASLAVSRRKYALALNKGPDLMLVVAKCSTFKEHIKGGVTACEEFASARYNAD